jgi:hypothetical protein
VKVEDFEKELRTLIKMFPVYCADKHQNRFVKTYRVEYGSKEFTFEVELCSECHSLFAYAVERLTECPHDPKPRCRKCPDPCYEREKYKQMARIMAYTGMKLGLSKVKRTIGKFFKK